jgi:hypothetical protein
MDLVGIAEVAEMAGVSKQAVSNWRVRARDFPAPEAELASGPVWLKANIENWLKMREGNMETIISGVTGSGKLEANEMGLIDFDRVEIANAVEAEIVHSDKFSVQITVDDNLFRYVDVSKSGSTLRVVMKPRISFWHATARAAISMPDLRGLKLSGASHAVVRRFDSTSSLDIQLSGASRSALENIKTGETHIDASGASRVTGALETGDINMRASGASSVELKGHGGNMAVEANGASHLRLENFTAVNADVRLSGASSASVNLNGKLDANLSGASHLTYDGAVSLGRLQVTGASSLKQK